MALPVDYEQSGVTRTAIGAAIDADFGHIVLMVAPPYPDDVAQWAADELIAPQIVVADVGAPP